MFFLIPPHIKKEQKLFLTEHINSTKQHISQLSDKKYDDIDTALDFTMMFIPIEPAYLLAIQNYPDLTSYAYFKRIFEIQKKHRPSNSRILNGIQTNGTLLDDEWCQFLASENFIVGISIDGPEELHSFNRHFSDGRSAFKQTLRGYRLLQSYRIPCEVLCVVSADNDGEPQSVYRYYKELDARFITFLPLVEKNLNERNLVSGQSVQPKAFGEFLMAIVHVWKSPDIGIIKI